jgi:hypothetical protein
LLSSLEELARNIGRTRQQLAGILGVFGKKVINRYHLQTWPFDARESYEHQMYVYVISDEAASAIRKARSGDQTRRS